MGGFHFMKTLVIGAHGRVGKIITQKLKDGSEHEIVAGLRKQEQVDDYKEQGYQTALIDLKGSIEDIQKELNDVEAIVFSAGSGDNTGADLTMMVDLDGAIKTMKAAQNEGITRFVMVSAANVDDREFWSYGLNDLSPTGNYYFAAKHYADEWLQNSGLDYTILRPTLLLDEEGRGKVEAAENLDFSDPQKIPREDVAKVAIASLNTDSMIGKVIDLNQGDTPIEDAVKNI